MKSQKLLKT